MSFLDDLHRVKRSKDYGEKQQEQHVKISRLRKEQKYKDLEPMIRDALDALGMATWGTKKSGERDYKITADTENFQYRLHSGAYEYIFKVIYESEKDAYFEVGVMGNLARSLDTSKESLERIVKTIFKRGPDYLGEVGSKSSKRKKKKK